MTMSDQELCHFISKPIGDEKDTLKSFMTFDITLHEPVFKVIVNDQFVVPQQTAKSPILFHPLTPNLFSH